LSEAAVQASPRDAALRVALAQAYMQAGRFQSAATTYDDAMDLGDNSARTALSLALSDIAAGKNAEAVAILDDWRDAIPASDLGLALSLAGESSRGVAILADALRAGDNTAKLRQNLAYSYALDGRWREARLMMSQDVPADQVGDRISEWATSAAPEAFQQRVATLLGVPLRSDSGQPQALALGNNPSTEQLAAEAGALKPDVPLAAAGELPAVVESEVAAAPQTDYAPVQPVENVASVSTATAMPVQPSSPIAAEVQREIAYGATIPAPPAAIAVRAVPTPITFTRADFATPSPAVRPASRRPAISGTHQIQLGAFSSAQGARRAWGLFAARNPELRNHRMVITSAVVRGKNFWRVAAAGFNGSAAQGMCSNVRTRGGVCFAYITSTRASAPGAAPVQGASGPQNARRK
jgi:hypothetical protein